MEITKMDILLDNEVVKAFNTVGMTVEEMLNKYIGGKIFFDNLDASWRGIEARRNVVKFLLDFVSRAFPRAPIIASGRFGMYLHNAHDRELRYSLRTRLQSSGRGKGQWRNSSDNG
jgi:hypothetical protein